MTPIWSADEVMISQKWAKARLSDYQFWTSLVYTTLHLVILFIYAYWKRLRS